MPYTSVWVTNSPSGSQAANTADDEFRKLRQDLEDRLEDKIIDDVTTDPWVVKPELKGNVVGKKIYLHHSSFVPHSASAEFRNDNFTNPNEGGTGTDAFWSPLIIPVDCIVQEVTGTFDRQGGHAISITFGYVDALTGAYTVVSTDSDAATAGIFQKSTSGIDLTHTIVTGRYYLVKVTLDRQFAFNSSRLYGAFVRYDTPDCRNTV